MAKLDFAGLSDDQLNLVVFEDQRQLASILESLQIKTSGDKILNEAGEPARCECCKDQLSTKNLGNIMPGSTLLFCDDPFCLGSYIAEHSPNEA